MRTQRCPVCSSVAPASSARAISESEILYPYIHRPGVLVAMSSEAYDKYRAELADDGTLIYESNLVKPAFKEGQQAFGIRHPVSALVHRLPSHGFLPRPSETRRPWLRSDAERMPCTKAMQSCHL